MGSSLPCKHSLAEFQALLLQHYEAQFLTCSKGDARFMHGSGASFTSDCAGTFVRVF